MEKTKKYMVIENIEGFSKGEVFEKHYIDEFLLAYDLKPEHVLGIYFRELVNKEVLK